jgi:hypothetical protein
VLEDQRGVQPGVAGAEWKGCCGGPRKLRSNVVFAVPHSVLWALCGFFLGVLDSQSS